MVLSAFDCVKIANARVYSANRLNNLIEVWLSSCAKYIFIFDYNFFIVSNFFLFDSVSNFRALELTLKTIGCFVDSFC